MILWIPKLDLSVGEMGSMFCNKNLLLVTRIQVSDQGLNDPLVVCKIDFSHMGKPEGAPFNLQKLSWASTQENLS